jgi:asparagine synthetase B (glutamine-hydrolysing)
MTVDSEAIFALMEERGHDAAALELLFGSMAAAWLDERREDELFLARGLGRPLWLGQGDHELFFASTEAALELVERYAGLELVKREVPEGTLLTVGDGRTLRTERFEPDKSFREEPLPAVRAPDERRSALARLAAIAVAAR